MWRRRSRRSRSPRRAWSRSTSSSPARRATCTPAGTAAPSRTRARARARSSPACTTPTARSPSPASTTASQPLAAADRRRSRACRSTRTAYRAEVGVPALHGEPGFTTLERLWTRPTLEVNGIEGGGRFTVIPRRARAHITCRLVPGQEPDAVVDGVEPPRRARARAARRRGRGRGRSPAACPPTRSRPTTRRSGRDAARSATVYPDQEPLLVRIGGTLPAAIALRGGPRA